MTNLRLFGLYTISLSQSRKRHGVKRLGLPKVACIILVFCLAAAITSPAQTFTNLLTFDFTDGSNPEAALVQGTDGNIYGTTTPYGGPNYNCNNDCGTVFKVTNGGKLTTLHFFEGTDGSFPVGLVQASNGKFYGTTTQGGSGICEGFSGCGTVFEMSPGGRLTTLHNFDGTDGEIAFALVQGIDGNFYGITEGGGTSTNCPVPYCGTVFKITPAGELTTLHGFDGTDGSGPNGIVQGIDRNFYGTTSGGGVTSTNCPVSGCGTVFKIAPAGKLTTLHDFDGTDGFSPNGVVQGTDGNFYGTTAGGGSNSDGTVFKITSGGTLTTLYSFGGGADGGTPWAGLVQGTDGDFYGTTTQGGAGTGCYPRGAGACGTIFKITPAGNLTTLYSFNEQGGGSEVDPESIAQGTNGTFYGVTYQGGPGCGIDPFGCGTIFSLSTGLGPFVETRPTSGKVGETVTILGTNLTGATSVLFDGKGAQFTVVSRFEIEAIVPAGAMTGGVEVTTPNGTLKSNVLFRVIP